MRSYRSAEWAGWFEAAGTTCPPVTGAIFDSSIALAELAASGAGAALLPVAMFEGWITLDRLAQPFGVTVNIGRYYLAWPSDRQSSPAMRVFTSWLTGK
ncbi:LysR substrate-binding domain-containing protein [Epibacterium sp. Ofav1-8]|uniref:LysR substrate-binding domain-containing protein n=1 Tax=Epibacterium sp. Ofav1-8 TaxID=2917735 RepID=UPI0021080F46|nr:LysR substrate-binding domain-containing protein [Epibacterium sp. Ofav1-8]